MPIDSGSSSTRSGTGDKPLKKFELKDFITNPQDLANEYGASEDNTIISTGGITTNLPESEQRFAKKKDSPFFAGQDVGEDYYTKIMTTPKKLRADGTEKDDDKPVKKAAPATTTTTEETSETTTQEQTNVEKATDELVAAANATAASSTASTPATQAAAQPKKKGQKGGTIATSPQGISMDDDTGLRPFRGLLADETKKKKTLIA